MVDAFYAVRQPERTKTLSPNNMIGNFISGVAGVPPQTLLDQSWEEDVVQGTSLDGVELECAYKASRDGWSAVDFHEAMDERGSGLVVALSRSGALFGGFNPLGWRSTDDYCASNAAFLWFVKGSQVVKCPILQGGKFAYCAYYCLVALFFLLCLRTIRDCLYELREHAWIARGCSVICSDSSMDNQKLQV
jgi:hypothetical protein